MFHLDLTLEKKEINSSKLKNRRCNTAPGPVLHEKTNYRTLAAHLYDLDASNNEPSKFMLRNC